MTYVINPEWYEAAKLALHWYNSAQYPHLFPDTWTDEEADRIGDENYRRAEDAFTEAKQQVDEAFPHVVHLVATKKIVIYYANTVRICENRAAGRGDRENVRDTH